MSDLTAYQSVVLMQPDGMTDGAVQYRSVSASALVIREEDALPGMPQGAELRAEFLLQSPVPPLAGARLRLNGRLLQISSVRTCRNLNGRVRCYRCEALCV